MIVPQPLIRLSKPDELVGKLLPGHVGMTLDRKGPERGAQLVVASLSPNPQQSNVFSLPHGLPSSTDNGTSRAYHCL